MPPAMSEDEASDISEDAGRVPIKAEKGKAVTPVREETLMVETDEDDEVAEDEFVVEAILDHMIDQEDDVLKFKVKWEGYENEEDMTWEPEENLETASAILNQYLERVGGKNTILADWEEKKQKKKSKKRGRASTNTDINGNGSKRGKKNGAHPQSETPPVSAKKAEFKPPTGNWEEEVVGIDACEGTGGELIVYLTWKTGEKSRHPKSQVYKRCPQKMLQFYENHLVFKRNDDDV